MTARPARPGLHLQTGRYSTHLPEHGAAVRTTVSAPKWQLPYPLAGHLREVTPDAPWLAIAKRDWPAYRALYRGRLDAYGLDVVLDAAEDLAARVGTDRLVLLCFCALDVDGEGCHRRLLAGWLEQHGISCPEVALPTQGRLL